MKKIIIAISLYLIFSNSQAGINGLTIHSRANCVNNESISWDWTRDWNLWTTSDHYDSRGALLHSLPTGWDTTWRSAAVHWGEGGSGWKVHGWHWTRIGSYIQALGNEWVVDCSIYDGWWDNDK